MYKFFIQPKKPQILLISFSSIDEQVRKKAQVVVSFCILERKFACIAHEHEPFKLS